MKKINIESEEVPKKDHFYCLEWIVHKELDIQVDVRIKYNWLAKMEKCFKSFFLYLIPIS